MGEKCVKTSGVFARVVGYYRKVSSWNAGKQNEWRDRKLSDLRAVAGACA